MTFENKTRGQYDQGTRQTNPIEKKNVQQAKDQDAAQPDEQGKTIGLSGGQHPEDKGGVDVSQYTGPGSKPSTALNDPESPYGTGPGNGLNQGEETEDDWENPEPENDSF